MHDEHTRWVADHYDKLAGNGPFGTLAPHNKGGRKGEYVASVFDAALLRHLEPSNVDRQILDFGCGTGIFACKIVHLAGKVIGVDVSAGMLVKAEQLCGQLDNTRFELIDGMHVPLPDKSTDIVIAREVLCHVPDERLDALLCELRRVTRPDGRFLLLDQVSRSPRWQNHPQTPHTIRRNPAELHRLAEQCGWSLLHEWVVRTPRFPWIYPVWAGLVPRGLIPTLARWEVRWHELAGKPFKYWRWWDSLFIFQNPADE